MQGKISAWVMLMPICQGGENHSFTAKIDVRIKGKGVT